LSMPANCELVAEFTEVESGKRTDPAATL
jgi:hypothetical protein